MKLAHYQIEQIREYINAQNIWYQDVKDELLDHMVCAVEEDMIRHNSTFVDAVAKVIVEVKPNRLQRTKLKTEHVRTYKEAYLTLIEVVTKQSYLIALAIGISAAAIFVFSDLNELLNVYTLGFMVLLFYNFFVRTWNNRAFYPLYNTFFMSRLNALYMPGLIIPSLVNAWAADWLTQQPWLLLGYFSLFNCYVIISFLVLNKSFIKLRKHASTQ